MYPVFAGNSIHVELVLGISFGNVSAGSKISLLDYKIDNFWKHVYTENWIFCSKQPIKNVNMMQLYSVFVMNAWWITPSENSLINRTLFSNKL